MTEEDRFKHRIVIPLLEKLPNTYFFIKEACVIRGIADIIGCVNGRFFAWELKKSREDAEERTGRIVLQRHNLVKINKSGGVARFVFPENIEVCIEELRRVANGTRADAQRTFRDAE